MQTSRKYILYALVFSAILLLATAVFVIFHRGQNISEQTAIEKAKAYCAQIHSPPQQPEHDIQATLMTCDEALAQGWNACDPSSQPGPVMVWLVTMNGLWVHAGPPQANGSPTSLTVTDCAVTMDAVTGELFSIRSNGK